MNLFRALAASALMLGCAAPALAGGEVGDFNYNETTGLINIPVARVAPAGSVQLSLGFHDLGNGQPFGLDVDDLFVGNDGTLRLIAGLPGNVEVSVMGLHGGFFRNNRYIFGAKWLAIPQTPDHPGFAIGVQSLNSGPEPNNPHPAHFDDPSAFGVVSHSFPLNDSGMALDLHAGIGTGRLRDGFAGGELHLIPELSVMGETDGTIESAGIKITPGRRFEILASMQFQDPIRYGVMFSYRFGPTEQPDWDAEDTENPPPAEPKAGTTRDVTPTEVEPQKPPGAPESALPATPVVVDPPRPEVVWQQGGERLEQVPVVTMPETPPPPPEPVAAAPPAQPPPAVQAAGRQGDMPMLRRDRNFEMPMRKR